MVEPSGSSTTVLRTRQAVTQHRTKSSPREVECLRRSSLSGELWRGTTSSYLLVRRSLDPRLLLSRECGEGLVTSNERVILEVLWNVTGGATACGRNTVRAP